ncbi:MAG TPA: peptidase S10 [Acidobacteriaceae bacterium]|jgi:carboxypeptidase C (cathepsin A)|nr:peptidase S10 [Acidobacteriaceae bacterium]
MKRIRSLHAPFGSLALGLVLACPLLAQNSSQPPPADGSSSPGQPSMPHEPDSITTGLVTAGGEAIHYRAIAGTLTVGSTDAIDNRIDADGQWLRTAGVMPPTDPETAPATARIFYAAYFRTDPATSPRPIIFLYNGGPSTASVWLHMGAFGPRRVVIPDTAHPSGAPYPIVENQYTLLDVADLVFIDAPGTGYSRIMGRDHERAFWGVDQDAHAFERFIRRFLSKYDLWNHPKYLFGESYGTPRSAVLAADLQYVDLNGIILLSQILSMDNSIDAARGNPGVDQAFALALPSFAAAAFYHHRLSPQPPALEPFLTEVENFALGDYMAALLKGSTLPPDSKRAMAERLHQYTGLSADLYLRYNLRIDVGVFCKNLLRDQELVTGRLDSRYTGPDPNPGAEETDPGLDPLGTATGAAYFAAVNHYLRSDLKFGANDVYQPMLYSVPAFHWDWRHQGPDSPAPLFAYTGTSMMLDLAFAMKHNPKMKVFLAGGYFDLGTPYLEGIYEMHHLPMPDSLQNNISYHYYRAGHMIYVNEDILRQFHADVAAFIRSTETNQ